MTPTRQPTYHCPGCSAELPRLLAYGLLSDIEAGRRVTPYTAPCCQTVQSWVSVRTYPEQEAGP